MHAVWVQCDVLTAEKASIASGLEAKERQMGSMQQEHTRLQDQLLLCQERVAQLQSDLLQVRIKSIYCSWQCILTVAL